MAFFNFPTRINKFNYFLFTLAKFNNQAMFNEATINVKYSILNE